ncbi:hypothetical protein R3I94_017580 [Phoxinus phoxinus]
MYYSALQ